MKILYFAWLRERIGFMEEEREIPAEVQTISQLIDYLITLDESYAYAFENKALIRAALDQKHSKHDALIHNAKVIAFFPPMTGG